MWLRRWPATTPASSCATCSATSSTLPTRCVDLVLDAAGGNPFYVEELVTWLVDAGVMVRGDPTWRVVPELVGTVQVPNSLRGVLQARLDALDPLQRSVLQRAAVVGRVYWDAAVAHLADHGTVDVGRVHDELRRRELVFERADWIFASAREFVFRHGLLRDVAYDGVLRAHRERYHRLAGEWLAETSARSGREDEFAAVVAEHFDKARDERAGAWYLRAGQQGAAVHALEEASRLLGRALELADNDLARFEALVARERVSDYLGDRAAQLADLDTLDGLLARLPDDAGQPRRRTSVLIARARVDFALGNYDSAEPTPGPRPGCAAGAGLGVVEAEAVLVHGKSQTWRGNGSGAAASLTYALELAREHGSAPLVAETLRYLSMLANNEGRLEEALDWPRSPPRCSVPTATSRARRWRSRRAAPRPSTWAGCARRAPRWSTRNRSSVVRDTATARRWCAATSPRSSAPRASTAPRGSGCGRRSTSSAASRTWSRSASTCSSSAWSRDPPGASTPPSPRWRRRARSLPRWRGAARRSTRTADWRWCT